MVTRRIPLITLLLVIFALMAGVSAAQDEPVELVFSGWGGPEEGAVFQQLVDTFNANNPDIRIVYQQIPTDYVTALKTAIAGGTAPDIAYIPDGDFSAFVPTGALVSLQDFVDNSETLDLDDIWPSALGRYRYDSENKAFGTGELYALPKDIGPTMLYINVDLFNEYGVELPDPNVPMTWDELVEKATLLTRDSEGRTPVDEGFDINNVVTWGVANLWFENIIYGNGGRLISEDGRTWVGSDDPNTIEAVQWIADLRHVYQVHPGTQQTASMSEGQMFDSGIVGMTTNGRWATTYYRSTLPFEWDVVPPPVGPSGSVTAYANQEDCAVAGWSGSVGLAIIAGTNGEANADKAYRFIEYIAGSEGQIEQAALGFQIPNQISVAETDAFLQPDLPPANAEMILELARCQSPGPWTQTPLYGQWFDDNWWRGLWPEVVLDGTKLAEDAFAERGEALQAGLDEAWASLD